jgi:2-amino-4-hydroxy-6-hydroxymethyldihydropteridine diphosphokinase
MSEPSGRGRAFVAVGSNIEPRTHIPAALQALQERVTVTACSSFYRTAPLGCPGQPSFVNGVWQVQLPGEGETLKEICREVETELGRRRTPDRYAPRPIDLDVVYRDDHPGELDDDLRRSFVCVPLLEIAPDLESTRIGLFARDAAEPGKQEQDLTVQLREMLRK